MLIVRAVALLALRELWSSQLAGSNLAMQLVIAAVQQGRPLPGRLTVIRLKLATACDPSLIDAWAFLAEALIARGRRRKAAAALVQGLAANSLGYSDLERFAEIFGACGADQLNRCCLLASAMEAPHRPDAWSLLGASYMARRRYHAAQECFLKATRIPKDLIDGQRLSADPEDVRDLGRVQYLLDLEETALRTLQRALEMDARDILTLTYLAQCHRKLGHQKEFDRIVTELRARQEAAEDNDWDDDEDEPFDWETELFGQELVQAQRWATLDKLIEKADNGKSRF